VHCALCTNPSHNADLTVSLCHRCPACVDCSRGVPLLRDGYTVGTTVDIQGMRRGVLTDSNTLDPVQFPKPIPSAEPWKVYFAFFCDEDTAVTPAIMTEMHYFTTSMANVRCNHGCNSSTCDSTNRRNQLELPVLSKSINEAIDAHTASSISHANMAVDATKSRMKCSEGYDGSFCRSCESESVDIFDRMFHGADSHAVQYFKPPGKHDSCEKCVGDTFHWHVVAVPLLAALCVLAVKIRNKFKAKRAVVTEPNELRLSTVNDPAEADSATSAGTCKNVLSQLGTIKTAVFPALKILITCEYTSAEVLFVVAFRRTLSVPPPFHNLTLER
jgi:hypothetical protein